ncbi:ArsR/SmtB family transcription factor [Pacificispira sp.]|uniref:ArsR/SmtB family transcription factor n=1 Tax=Pacificispira sp. TaxID=2888761 RepID=UPI003BAAC890
MKEGPDIALIASLIGDPARANMLTAMMDGKAYTATELAAEAGITQQTASTHLKKLETGGLILQRKQGRHRYFALSDDQVGNLLESMMGLAAARDMSAPVPARKIRPCAGRASVTTTWPVNWLCRCWTA